MNKETMRIEIFDTVLRDGDQSLPKANQFDPGTKVELADQIVGMGVDTIEAGFPATAGDGEEVAEVARTIGRQTYTVIPKTIQNGELVALPEKIWTPVITGLSLARPNDIEATWASVQEADKPGIHTFVATAEEHMRAKHEKKTIEEILEMGQTAIRHARDVGGSNTRIEFSCEAASTSDPKTLDRFIEMALDEDIDVLNLPDTLGAASPKRMASMFSRATELIIKAGREKDVMISSHNHDDGQRAVQNAISSLHAVIDTAASMGATPPRFQIEGVAAPSLGERNGNTFLAPFVRNVLTDRQEFDAEIDMQVDTTRVKAIAEFVCAQAGVPMDRNTPVVGKATTEHRSGVHSDGIIKGGPAIYSAVNPQWFGHEAAAIIDDGKYQGERGRDNLGAIEEYRSELVMTTGDVSQRIADLNMSVNEQQLEKIVVASNAQARSLKRRTSDIEIEQFVAEETDEKLSDSIALTTHDHHKNGDYMASVTLQVDGKEAAGSATHSKGSIDALIKATNEALGFDGDYEDWHSEALASGSDASGSVMGVVKQNGYRISTFASSESVDEASLSAYIKAINTMRRIEQRSRKS